MPDHDHSYKNLFSHPKMVEDLLKGFVKFDWVDELDFSTLEKLNNSYITDDIRERADDVIWRVKFRGQWLYLYLLLEFQSTVDPWMAVRILTYVGLLYQDLIKTEQLPVKKQLPPVLPIVLYNGDRAWQAAESISELMQSTPEMLQAFQPQQRYLLIDEGRYSKSELEHLDNVTAALIRAEIADSQEELVRVLANLIVWLPMDEQRELRRAFKEWFNRILLPRRLQATEIEEVRDLTEIQTMLAERVKDWTHSWREEGFKEGIEKGEATVLSRQLARRFGPLPAWAEEKLQQSTRQQLEIWADRIFEAESLEQFFA
jgi:predicted transposase/invertase (TIGR01784 family)